MKKLHMKNSVLSIIFLLFFFLSACQPGEDSVNDETDVPVNREVASDNPDEPEKNESPEGTDIPKGDEQSPPEDQANVTDNPDDSNQTPPGEQADEPDDADLSPPREQPDMTDDPTGGPHGNRI